MVVTADAAASVALVDLLERQDFSVEAIGNGREAEARLADAIPDLLLLDLVLPGLSGLDVCRRARAGASTSRLPIMIVTARDREADRVRGLDAGADDYVVRPFSERELIARIRAILRRAHYRETTANVLTIGDIVLDRDARRATRSGRALRLGPIEFALLDYLMRRAGRSVSRAALMESIWGPSAGIIGRTIDVNVGRLRRALSSDEEPDPIQTVRGEGYKFDL